LLHGAPHTEPLHTQNPSEMYGGEGASQFEGGFMPSPAGMAEGSSPAMKVAGQKRNETLTPLTVRQLHTAIEQGSESGYLVDGEELHQLTILGKVTGVQPTSTMTIYKLDDGTGVVEVRLWNDSDDNTEEASAAPVAEGTYVRVFGNLRVFQGKTNVVAFAVRPVTDFNEVTYHSLEAIFVHLGRVKAMGAPPPATPMMGVAPGSYATPTANMGAYTGGAPAANTAAGGESLQSKLIALFESPQATSSDAGMSTDEVYAAFQSNYPAATIRQSIDNLVSEGHLYSTIDDNHFKSTSC